METNMKSVRVNVESGMFKSEVVATLDAIGGNYSFFVRKDKIERSGENYFLKVYLLGENNDEKIDTIALPLYVEGAQKRVFDVRQTA
ncbi:hypothetical protein [Acidithiobacillus ferriphilus]|uniref:hypothetical protein n=1 Tax=Acidithiobacillus ferriphilus TaxID=1689834 RepID=UPI001C06C21E|nr:hypothetical protein [Acidithiobacillus ferriphilus]MBU2852962.1 hypothetical protein [Acidithiobacillus ferriphilus]